MPRLLLIALIALLFACNRLPDQSTTPNVILIMADDLGYECLSIYGSRSYHTPNLDRLAAEGLLFQNAQSQPLCTPSRVKIMTGQYNYRNYDYFVNLHENAYTFGNLMRDAGYATAIAGKWQLNGLYHDTLRAQWKDTGRLDDFGFDEYCLWQLTETARGDERYAYPLIEQNGQTLPRDSASYGPAIFSKFIRDYISRHREQPFFVYYPMVLPHAPFVPTPDSPDWTDPTRRYRRDTAYFKDMVAYIDKIFGQITAHLETEGLREETLILFTGDNGTHRSIISRMEDGTIIGGKGKMDDSGVHVPLIASWPGVISPGREHPGLIEFSDFFPTLAELSEQAVESDGHSFYPLLRDKAYTPRETAFVHYDPQWSARVNAHRGRFVRTPQYKLYQDGRFFNLGKDIREENPLSDDELTDAQRAIRTHLEEELTRHPPYDFRR